MRISVRKLLSAGLVFLVVLSFASLAFANSETGVTSGQQRGTAPDAGTAVGTPAVPDTGVDTRPQEGMTPPPAVPPATDSQSVPGATVTPTEPSAPLPSSREAAPGDQGAVEPMGPESDSSSTTVTVPPETTIIVPGPAVIVPAPEKGSGTVAPSQQQSAPSDMGTIQPLPGSALPSPEFGGPLAPAAQGNVLTRPAQPGGLSDVQLEPGLKSPAYDIPDVRPQQGSTPPPAPATSEKEKFLGAPGTQPIQIPSTPSSQLPGEQDLRLRQGTTPPPESEPSLLRPQTVPESVQPAPATPQVSPIVPSPARPEASPQVVPLEPGADIIIITPVPQGSSSAPGTMR